MDKTILTDKSIDLLVALRKGQPEHYAEEDRENIERGLELLTAQLQEVTANEVRGNFDEALGRYIASMNQAQAAPVVYEVKGE